MSAEKEKPRRKTVSFLPNKKDLIPEEKLALEVESSLLRIRPVFRQSNRYALLVAVFTRSPQEFSYEDMATLMSEHVSDKVPFEPGEFEQMEKRIKGDRAKLLQLLRETNYATEKDLAWANEEVTAFIQKKRDEKGMEKRELASKRITKEQDLPTPSEVVDSLLNALEATPAPKLNLAPLTVDFSTRTMKRPKEGEKVTIPHVVPTITINVGNSDKFETFTLESFKRMDKIAFLLRAQTEDKESELWKKVRSRFPSIEKIDLYWRRGKEKHQRGNQYVRVLFGTGQLD